MGTKKTVYWSLLSIHQVYQTWFELLLYQLFQLILFEFTRKKHPVYQCDEQQAPGSPALRQPENISLTITAAVYSQRLLV
jgi:hypothetical protein